MGMLLIAGAEMPTTLTSTCSESTSLILKLFLHSGANSDTQVLTVYFSALHQAIKHDHDECVQLLLDRGALTQDAARKKHLELGVPLKAVFRIQRNFRRRSISDTKK